MELGCKGQFCFVSTLVLIPIYTIGIFDRSLNCNNSYYLFLRGIVLSFISFVSQSSGISLHIPKFRSGKSSKSDSGQGSSSDGPLSDSQGSEGSPPTERAPAVKILTGEGSRSNSPTMERSKLGGKRSVESSSASIQMMLDPSDAEFRPKGAGSLKAYSYSHPPPPSYRRVYLQKRATSPSTPEQPLYPLEVNFSPAQESEVRKSPDEPLPSASPSEHDSASKPSFASFSEETRRRLLKLNLQKKAAEKRRQSEGEREVTSPPSDRSDETPRDTPRERKISDQGVFESMDQLSSSSTSRSSSAHSSKNPSLDSLHVSPQPQLDKVASLPVTSHSETPRVNDGGVKTMSLPSEALREVVPRSNETVVAVVKGRGVVSGTLRQFEPTRRPASLDIPTKRENAEELRLARRSLGSEESSDTSSDEGDECAISMSKTFDEKLRILLDLGSTFGNKEGENTHSDDDKSSVRSEPPRRLIANNDEMAQRRASDEPGRVYKIVGVNPSTDTHDTVSTPYNTRTHVPRHETPETEFRSNSLREINTRKYFAAPSPEERVSSQPPSPARTAARGGTPVSSDKKVGDLRQRFESSPSKGKVSGLTPKSNQVKGREGAPPVARKKIGSVRTTTPVSLKEFNVKPVKTSAAPPVQVGGVGRGVQRGTAQRPPESRAVSSRNIRLESSPVKHSSTSPVRYSAERTDSGVDRTTPRARPNANVATNERSKGPPVVGKTHVPPRVMNREYGSKSKLLSHKDSAKELLPSKARLSPRDVRGSQTQSKLEKDAQHIAELLEEMHSERYLHLSRQQSDISGQAQKAAAQRAAIRRRSLGDDNNPVTLQMANSPADERENISTPTRKEVSQGGYNTWRPDVRPNSPQRGGNNTRSAFHTVKR